MDQQPSRRATTTAIPDSECILESSIISVLVKDTKFRLDSYFLQRESETLKGIITASKGDSIRLDGATIAEFRALWRYFYEGMYDDYKPSTTEWIDLLSIANTYGFTKVRHRAISELGDLDGAIDPIERILLAKRLRVNRWLAPAYAALCIRRDPITASEAEKLGMHTFVALIAARDNFFRDNPVNPEFLVTPGLRCCGHIPAQFTVSATGCWNCPSCGKEAIRAPTSKVVTPNPNVMCCINYSQYYWWAQPDGSQRCRRCQGITVPAPTTIESLQESALAIVNRVFALEDKEKKDKKL